MNRDAIREINGDTKKLKELNKQIEIELMKSEIFEYCNDYYTLCPKCFIEDICSKYQAPVSNKCNEWNEDDIKEAHGILKAAEEWEW